MLGSVSLKTAAIPEIIEQVRLQIEAERLHESILQAEANVHSKLTTGMDGLP